MDTESNWSKDKWMEVKAKQTDIGTFPQGSQWRKNPCRISCFHFTYL